MKKITNYLKFFVLILLVNANVSFAQLTGIKTIPGTYATIALAITDLNTSGVGSGGVTFNIAAGYTETAVNLIITATGTTANPIVFQKSGAGANPLITAGNGTTTNLDGIIKLQGVNYITFDGIDLVDPASNNTNTLAMEFGYAVLKNAVFSLGSQHITIKNCVITLQSTVTQSTGIYSNNHTPSSASALVTNPSYMNEFPNAYNQYTNNTISNSTWGIRLVSYSTANYQYTVYLDHDNQISGNTISSFGGSNVAATSGIYIYYQLSAIVTNNNISNGSTTLAIAVYGIYDIGAITPTTAVNKIYSNTISSISNSGTGIVYGIYASSVSDYTDIYQNTINTLSATGAGVYGIYKAGAGTLLNVYGNKIYDLSTTGASSVAYGVQIAAGVTSNLYNNIIGDLRATVSTSVNAVIGMDFQTPAGTFVNAYYNSIYISGTGGAGFGSSGINSSTNPTLALKNNLVVNACTPGTGLVVAFRRSSTTLTSYSATSGNNLFYAGVPSASHLIYYDGTNSDQTICTFKDRMVAPRETGSVTELPSFISTVSSNVNFLHLNTAVANLAESGGVEIAGYTTDYDGTGTRPAGGYPLAGQTKGGGFKPDIGADETDATPGVMTYQCSNTVQVTGIATQGGTNNNIIRIDVSATGYTTPKSVTQFTVNANGTTAIANINAATAKIYYTGTDSNFSAIGLFGGTTPTIANFNINGSQALQAGVNYFWLTYDIGVAAPCGNFIDGECISMIVAAASKTPSVTAPAGNKIIKGGCSIPFYTIDNTLPASCSNYINFTTAIADLNLGTPGCPVVYHVKAGQTFNESNMTITASGTAANTITFVKSGAGANPVIKAVAGTGTLDGIVKFSGADYVIFDGIDLQENATNVTTTTQMEWGFALLKSDFTNGSQHIQIKNCSITLDKTNPSATGIYGGNHTPASVTQLVPINISGTNSYNTIDAVTISNVATGISLSGYNSTVAPYSFYDQQNYIGVTSGNTFTSFGNSGAAYSCGVYSIYQNNIRVMNNTIKDTVTAVANKYPIYIGAAINANADIANNFIQVGGIGNANLYMIYVASGAKGTSNTNNIYNNNINYCTASTTFYGIYIYCATGLPGTGTALTTNIYSNQISYCVSQNSFIGMSESNYDSYTAINNSSSANQLGTHALNVHDNIEHDCSAPIGLYALYSSSESGIANIYNNSLYSCICNNASAPTQCRGFVCNGGTSDSLTTNMYNNTVHDITLNSPVSASSMRAIEPGGSNGVIHDNTVYNITMNEGSPTGWLYGIYLTGGMANALFAVYNNTIYNFTTSSPIYGIMLDSYQKNTQINNNLVHDLTSGSSVTGLWNWNSVSTVYLNTLYNLTGGTGIAYGINTACLANVSYYDNIIYNVSASTAYGLYGEFNFASAANQIDVYRNKIYTITSTAALATTVAAGIYIYQSYNPRFYNNFIADIKAPNSANPTGAYGMYVATGSIAYIYYNSIYLNASSTGANFGSVGLYVSGAPSEEIINNLVENTSTPNGTGTTVALRVPSVASLTGTSDYNNYYSGTPSATNLIYYDGTNSMQTLAAYQALVTPREAMSLTIDAVPFFTSNTDLHLSNCVNCVLLDKAIPIALPTNDIDLETRPMGLAPEMGADEITGVLPIKLLDFRGENKQHENYLYWTAVSEINNDYFIVERSNNNEKDFEETGKVKGAGNSNTMMSYEYSDNNYSQGMNYYRLKQVDFDGNYTYSKTISISNGQNNKSIINIYPVPCNQELNYEFYSEGSSLTNITVTDVLGNVVVQEQIKTKRGIAKSKLNIENLSEGVYFLRMENGTGQSQIKFVKE